MFNLDALRESQSESATELLKRIRHIVVVGENDSSEFKRQSRTYFQVNFDIETLTNLMNYKELTFIMLE